MYSTAFWCLFVVSLIFLALLGNRCYSFHKFVLAGANNRNVIITYRFLLA